MKKTKGIILAGGRGTRLSPITLGVSKQLLPLYDKPMIYYPLATLMAAGIRDICIIVNSSDRENFRSALGDGTRFGISLTYIIQPNPEGIPQAFVLAEDFIGHDNICLMLGDNLLVGTGLGRNLGSLEGISGAHIFLYQVENPQNYGNVQLTTDGKIAEIIEKPSEPKSKFAIPGLYFVDNSAIEKSKNLRKSSRGEFEVVDLLKEYLVEKKLAFTPLARGTVWMDTGSPEDLFSASEYVRIIQKRQGTQIACLEEIALLKGWMSIQSLEALEVYKGTSSYSEYLRSLVQNGINVEPLINEVLK
jgi:glucose-1-phosphate thymidylyltransferase